MPEEIGEKIVAVGGMVWIPVRIYEKCDGVYLPKLYQIRSVGSESIHLQGHADELIKYCYLTEEECLKRCLTLFQIFTMRPYTDFPNI
jgi:hypothetical protein